MNSRLPDDSGRAPFFTIAVSCCNVAPYVRECLDSLVSQPFADWECVAWVEESTDGTEAILRACAARDPRFRLFFGPCTGSVSASRNEGIERARGGYILFLDGDDRLSPGCLARLHDAVAAAPGADIYPCALREFDHDSGRTLQTCDTFRATPSTGMTGREAILRQTPPSWPNPMLQLAVFRRAFLLGHGLRCIPGIRSQDMEFFPRALYLARSVLPLHECHYQYRFRTGSICSRARVSPDYLYDDRAVVYRSLLAFFARVSAEPDFDPRIGACWARAWIATQIAFQWFHPLFFRAVPRARRVDTLQKLFADGFGSFDRLRRFGDVRTRIVGRWIELFVRHPRLRGLVECLFRLQVALHGLKKRLPGHGTGKGARRQ